jgi:hypothetical protein
MATSILRDIQAAQLARRLDPITSRLWMLHGAAAEPLADRLAAGIVVAPRMPERGDEATPPSLGVAVLLH